MPDRWICDYRIPDGDTVIGPPPVHSYQPVRRLRVLWIRQCWCGLRRCPAAESATRQTTH